MLIQYSENFGHPWTRKKGWGLLEAKADEISELNSFISEKELEFWHVWCKEDLNVVMYRPSEITEQWSDNPS